MSDLDEKAREFFKLIKLSSNVVALTGAGISTESGIPDYRSPGTGLWGKIDQSIVSLDGFLRNPDRYYSYALELYPVRNAAKPNAAHYMLAELEKKGFLKGIITQNVDGLHLDAGSVNVHEIHGSLRQVVCLECNLLFPMENVIKRVSEGENPPICVECGGVLKPNAVFFGETLPRIPWQESIKLANSADLFIAMGSSLQVSPASSLPDVAIRAEAKLVIMNSMPTPYDNNANLIIREKVAKFSSSMTKYEF